MYYSTYFFVFFYGFYNIICKIFWMWRYKSYYFETEEDFEHTLDVVRKINYEQIYMFIYSRRVGTPGDKMENQIPEEIKHKRFIY